MSGYDCGSNLDCIQADGSGYLIVEDPPAVVNHYRSSADSCSVIGAPTSPKHIYITEAIADKQNYGVGDDKNMNITLNWLAD